MVFVSTRVAVVGYPVVNCQAGSTTKSRSDADPFTRLTARSSLTRVTERSERFEDEESLAAKFERLRELLDAASNIVVYTGPSVPTGGGRFPAALVVSAVCGEGDGRWSVLGRYSVAAVALTPSAPKKNSSISLQVPACRPLQTFPTFKVSFFSFFLIWLVGGSLF